MGCRESKHAVATANTTVSKSSSSKRSRSINKKSLENNTTTVEKRLKSTIDENVNATPVRENENVVKDSGNENVNIEKEIPDAVKKEEPEADKEGKIENAGQGRKDVKVEGKETNRVGDNGNGESGIHEEVEETLKADAVKVVEEMKGRGNEELNELEKEEGDGVNVDHEEEQEEERLMVSHDSSNHIFSPKKDHHEETIESSIQDGISGESDEYTPHAARHVPEGEVDGDDASGEIEMNREAESSAEKEEAIIVDEGKEVVPVDGTEGSASATARGEEETPVSEKENANATT